MNSKKLKELQRFNSSLRKDSWHNFQGFAKALLCSIDHPTAKVLLAKVQAGEWTTVVGDCDVIASTVFPTLAEHRLLHQLANIFRKYPYPEGVVSFDPRGEALKTFLRAEHKCKRTNQRFRAYRTCRSPKEVLLARARSFISYVLGDFDWSLVTDGCSFGAGASIGVNGSATNIARKLCAKHWSVTPSAFHYSRASLKKIPIVFESLTWRPGTTFFSVDPELFDCNFGDRVKWVDYNKISFVPKTAKTYRTIAVEPLLNGFLQKGVDVFMRKRLKRVGIDLQDQSLNQELARQGSRDWLSDSCFSTIDLSSASDSLSIELCRELLPPDWFEYLDSIRAKCYLLDGKKETYHKFVSMGNGFCFPLQTLIFSSLVHAVSGKGCIPSIDFVVYGDDIIVRKQVFEPLVSLLKTCGFSVNAKKTYANGPFRESCGADWFEGKDVRPLVLDYAFDSLENIFKFCNLSRSKDTWNDILTEACDYLKSLIPHSLYLCRPYKGNVDTCLEVSLDTFLASPFARWDRNIQSWLWVELRKSPTLDKKVRRYAGIQFALVWAALTGASSSSPFTERYSACTKIRRIGYSGAQSTYLPGCTLLPV